MTQRSIRAYKWGYLIQVLPDCCDLGNLSLIFHCLIYANIFLLDNINK